MQIKVIEDWRGAHKLWSVVVAVVGVIASTGTAAWLALDPSLRAQLPSWIPPTFSAVVFVCTILARLIQQPVFQKPEQDDAAAPPQQ